ncbi:putative transcription factor MYB family [Helianthus anomalus]
MVLVLAYCYLLLLLCALMDDAREYSPNQGYGSSSQLPKAYASDVNYNQSQAVVKYVDEEDDEEEEETNVGDNGMNETALQNLDDEDDDEDDNDNRYDDDRDDDNGEDLTGRKKNEIVNMQRHPKKRKLKSLLSSYELAPRVPPPTSTPKPSFGGRNTLTDWTEHETFVLLEAWGDRYIKCGKKSLRSEEWQEVADRVSRESKMVRTDSQCRNRLDTLKKKYKKEKANLKSGKIVNSKWVYFKKMDMLLSPVGNDRNVTINPSVKQNNSAVVYETRGSSGNSDYHEQDDDDDDSDLLPPKKSKPEASFKLLADSINKFSEMYEKIENNKIQQMIELEKMRMDFHRDLELQKRQILDRAQAEITKGHGDYEDNDVSAGNVSG